MLMYSSSHQGTVQVKASTADRYQGHDARSKCLTEGWSRPRTKLTEQNLTPPTDESSLWFMKRTPYWEKIIRFLVQITFYEQTLNALSVHSWCILSLESDTMMSFFVNKLLVIALWVNFNVENQSNISNQQYPGCRMSRDRTKKPNLKIL